jgi:glycosyltransferase involved in cell wall biosynthesis
MKVNVIAPIDNWILHRVAKELQSRLDYITITNKNKRNKRLNNFDINYYIPYAFMKEKSNKIDMALFTHIEESKNRKIKQFFDVARRADYCVTMSKTYEKILRNENISSIQTINLGINLDVFKPKLILGFIGRIYKSERKGDSLLEKIRDLDFVELRSTEGELDESELPNFYRQLDYTLVTSKYEGGPMCVPESLSCGIPVISPRVGQVPEILRGIYYYENSNFESLKKILQHLYEKKDDYRKAVEHLSWDNCVKKHDELFRNLVNG